MPVAYGVEPMAWNCGDDRRRRDLEIPADDRRSAPWSWV